MASYTLRVNDELEEEIEDFMADSDVNQSEDLRKLIRRGLEYDTLQARNAELRNQLQAANQKNSKIDELVTHREEERSLERMRSEAGVLTRAKWWLVGMSSEESDG